MPQDEEEEEAANNVESELESLQEHQVQGVWCVGRGVCRWGGGDGVGGAGCTGQGGVVRWWCT